MSTPTTYLIRPHSSGFFSNFLKVISVLQTLGPLDAAIVDWRLDAHLGHFPYGTASDGNIWDRLFEPLQFDDFPSERREVVLYPQDGVPAALDAYKMYMEGNEWRHTLGAIAQRLIKPQPDILSRVAKILPRKTDQFVVGVHYRHRGHNIEAPYPIPPEWIFIRQIKKVVRGKSDWLVFLATDDGEAAKAFRQAFGPRLIEQSSLSRSHTLQQVHETAPNGNLELAREVLVDALVLARTDVFFHIVSNVATATGLLNPNLEMVYCRAPFDEVQKAMHDIARSATSTWWGRPMKHAVRRLMARRSS